MNKLTVILILTVFTVRNSSYLIKVPTEPAVQPNVIGPVGWVNLQKLILPLFENVCEESTDAVVKRMAESFTFDNLNEEYLKPETITSLQKLKEEKGFLPKGEIFTEYNPDHMNELKTVYEVMYYAKNFDTFYKAAAWARQNLNCGLFVNAIYLTIQNRRDTDKLSVPAPYEVLPNYFIQKDVIVQASKLLSGGQYVPSDNIHNDGNTYTLDANYTAIFYDNNDESKLAYFREDIGLNSFYFLRKLKQAPWLNIDTDIRYGENMYHMMKQFVARYNLERYANGFPELNSINWNSSFDVPYDPMLIYANGNEFIHRSGSVQLPDNDDMALLRTIETNIGTVVNHLRDGGYNKTQILNHLMEIIVIGDRSYETLAHKLLGKDQSDTRYPSVLEHYMTSLRDPMFWIINNKIVDMIDKALQLLPPYSSEELFFPGVEIVNIDIKKMMTAFDFYEFDVTNALKISGDNTTFQVKIGQPRLNHKPFSIKMNVSSLVASKGLVKVYIGPKILPGELALKKNYFVSIDSFEYNFKPGTNIITRTSDAMKQFSKDFMSISEIRKRVQYAEYGLDSLPLISVDSQVGYPDRLILPKGTSEGLPLQMFVFIAPLTKFYYGNVQPQANVDFNSSVMSPGYPLDLSIESKLLLSLPNAILKDVILTHKSDSKVENYGGMGVTKKWYGMDTYDASARISKEPFDYASKKAQYGNKAHTEFNYQTDEWDDQDNNKQDSEQMTPNYAARVLLKTKPGLDVTKNQKDTQATFKTNPYHSAIEIEGDKTFYENSLTPDEVSFDESNTNINSRKHILDAVADSNYLTKKTEIESNVKYEKPGVENGNKNNFTFKNIDYQSKKDQYMKKLDSDETNSTAEISDKGYFVKEANGDTKSPSALPLKKYDNLENEIENVLKRIQKYLNDKIMKE